jgi:hypothetical protein
MTELPFSACGCRKFQIDTLGDYLCTCTAHSGAKKAHDWAVGQIADLFRRRHNVSTAKGEDEQIKNKIKKTQKTPGKGTYSVMS